MQPVKYNSLVPMGGSDTDGSNAIPDNNDEMRKRQRLERLREERAAFDTVTIGGANKPKPKPAPKRGLNVSAPSAPQSAPPLQSQSRREEMDEAPVYRFQIADAFDFDVPNMRTSSTHMTEKLSTTVGPKANSRKVVELGGEFRKPAPTPDIEQETMALVETKQSRALVDPDELLMTSIQQATSKRPAATMAARDTVAPNDELDIAGLHTAEDVVSYFSIHGTEKVVKFVYCNQAPRSLDFSPYDLQVVRRGEQASEHYVISATGVVHVKGDAGNERKAGSQREPAEVISLSDWMRESAMFNVLRRVRFFKTYLVYKAFLQWKKNIRLRLYSQTRRQLCKKFFLSKSTFASTTMDLYRTAYELTTTPLFHYEHQGKHDYTIDEFNRQQSTRRAEAGGEFSNSLEKIETRLTKLTETIQQRANVPDLTTMESLEQYLLANSVASSKDKKGGKKMKSMLEAKHEQYERMRELKRSMVEHSMLDSFIRLIDYIAAENIFKNALLTVMQFHSTVQDQFEKETKKVGFQILIHPTEDAMTYKPSETEIVKMYTDNVEEMVQTVNGVIRLMNQKPLKVFFAKPPKLWNIGTEFKRDARVIDTKQNTYALIHDDFERAQKKKAHYDGNIKWFAFIKRDWPERRDQWQAKMKDGFLTHDDIEGEYRQLAEAHETLKQLIPTNIGHTLFINAGRLKNELQPKIDQIKEEVDAMLTQTARARTLELQKYYHSKVKALSVEKERQPNSLAKFADFLKALNEVQDESVVKEEDADEAESLYTLMLEQGVDIEDNDKLLRERTLGGTQQNAQVSQREGFLDTVTKAQEFRDSKRHVMVQALNIDIEKVNDDSNTNIHVLNYDEYTTVTPMDRKPQDALHDYEAIPLLKEMEARVIAMRERAATCSEQQQLLEMQPPQWRELQQLETLFKARQDAWTMLQSFEELRQKWWTTQLTHLNVQEIETSVKDFNQRSHKLAGLMRSENFVDAVADEVAASVKQMKQQQLPVIMDCGNANMTKEHWQRVFTQIGQQQPYREDLNLGMLEEMDIWSFQEVVAEQAAMATGESNLTNALSEIDRVWSTVGFSAKKYRDDRDVYILEKVDDIVQQLDDHHVQLQTITASRFVGGVRTRVEDWMAKLRTVSDVIDEAVTMQKNWMYLEFIFSSPDIKVQLKEESDRFDQVDANFKRLMSKCAASDNRVLKICTDPQDKWLETLIENNKAIDEIQKRLEDYLETKRAAFPRFYFLSNDELLSILSDVRNPRAVQPHLSKCFDSVNSLIFNNEAATEIGGMKSGEGEEVSFDKVVHPVGNVEMWLGVIEQTMKTSLHAHTRDAYESYAKRVREEWFMDFPAQAIAAADMMVYTAEVEQAISEHNLKGYLSRYKDQILATVDLVRHPLTKLQRTLVCTLIVVDVHNRDVVTAMVDNNVQYVSDFDWVQQLRYYWETDATIGAPSCCVHHCTAQLWCGFEYIGNQPRLVITPLTDRAFLTCTSALEMNLGAAPQGPAGTGKTESVKDLGKALSRQVVVFNCSDGINYKTMSRMFAGLAQAGAWACFDEFNRIELEVLSVIAQQMLEIVMALGQKLEHMDFDGHPIRLSRNFGVFITMNPGYAGRTELPDNLKALFRPICMMIPDYALIAEIMFFSEGFTEARLLAQKMVQLYKLSSEQLSKQDHYDFGMRAVKSILVMAGALKRANPDEDEDMLLIRAMRDSNVPKFLREDTVLFMALIRDLFPNVDIKDQDDPEFKQYVVADLLNNNLQLVDGFVLKTRQLYDTLLVRHGVMMVGATMCAKTTIYETLQRTLTKLKDDDRDPSGDNDLYNVVETQVINPKSITMGELYGEVNAITREWTDGLLSGIARTVVKEALANKNRQWIVFDGPVDAIWIENMNTVLDDNKMLCLFNGERIKLPGTAAFMFEVQDLKVASPATVSRCGMVFVEPYYMEGGWRPIARSTVASMVERHTEKRFRGARVLELLESIVPSALEFLRANCREYIESVDAQLVSSLLQLLSAFVLNEDKPLYETETLDEDPADANTDQLLAEFCRPPITAKTVPQDAATLFDMYFIMSFIWSLGANLVDASRAVFSEFAKPLLAKHFPSMPTDPERTIYDITIHKPSLSFISWSYVVPDFTYNRNVPYFELFVPTVETTSVKTILNLLASVSRNVLLNGVTGTGKSIIAMDLIVSTLNAENPQSQWEYFTTAFSAQTRSVDLQDRLESKLTKVKGQLLGASPGKRAMFFIDDLNMPQLETYGASPPVELLRQFIVQGGFYDRKKIPSVFKEIQDVVFMCACGVPGGGRNELTQRLTSRFHLFCQPTVTTASMRRIFSTILGGFLNIWPMEVRRLTTKVVEATRQCYDRISHEKLPTPAKSHYTFNLRDFGKVFQGMLQATPSTVPDRDGMIRLFVHEISRVFHDRLIDNDDKQWWWATLGEVCTTEFDIRWGDAMESGIFGDFMRRSNRVYEEVSGMGDFQDKLVEYQMSFNVDNNKEVELVFFADAAHHVSRICRICRQPRGNALLVGVGGSGRQSLARLAAYICGMPVFQIAITRSYGIQDFRDNVKEALLESGCENKPVVFLLADSQIIKEQFLEDINNVLNTGEIPNLMQSEDNDKIIDSVRKFVKAAGKQETRGVMLSHFVQQCRDNFHIILTMSPIGEQFRSRLRMFPSLVNCSTIDWFTKWPVDALTGVAQRVLEKLPIDEETKLAVTQMCVRIHQDVQDASVDFFDELRRHNYTTPTSYLELLNSYTKMLDEQSTVVTTQLNRLQGGLDKLLSTQELVDDMKMSLTKMQPVLEQSAKDTEAIMKEVEVQTKESEVVKVKSAGEEQAANEIRVEANGVRAECQEKLDEAMPAFYGALEALKSLDSKDIGEIKGLGQPPERVRVCVEAVLVLLGHKDLSWNNCKITMGKSDFLNSLREYKKDDIPDKVIRTLQKNYLNRTDVEFTPENLQKASAACKSLAMWVIAINNYCGVAKTIAPKKEELAIAEAKLVKAEAAAKAAKDVLDAVEAKVAALKRKMQENMDKKKGLEDEMKLTELRLGRAEKLMNGLASEQIRWSASVAKLGNDRTELVGTMILAAGCVAYLGPFTSPYRSRLVKAWAGYCHELRIPVAGSDFSLADIADPIKVRQWAQKGLPMDGFSVENGVVLSRSQRWCLCVDPQGQANSWIRAMERDNNLKIIKLSEPNYMRTLENAVKVGLPVLLENVEESIDAVIDPILLRQTFRHQGRLLLKLGDQEIDYEPTFRFYMTTKLPNPHYTPELQIKVTIINFTVTQKGLEEQLLADVVRYERADLEQRADRTVVEIAEGRGQLKEIEERILGLLVSSTGNILDNEALINALADAKKTSDAVTQNLEVAEATQRDIMGARDRYRPVATRGSLIYTVIASIAGIEHMYQYSLDFFKRLFLQTLKRTEASDDVDQRVATLLPAVTLDSYRTVCRGLFERDKQLFAFLMVAEIFRENGTITDDEWQFFLKGSEGERFGDDSWPEWTTEATWNEVLALCSKLPLQFEPLKDDIWTGEAEWSTWAASDDAFKEVPKGYTELSPFQKLLLVRIFREDLLMYGITQLIGTYLGSDFTESPAFNLEASFEDSSTVAPIIFVLTTGTDPTSTFTEFADKKGFGDKKLMLSLGQDQGPKAHDMIQTACKTGQWVYLQNCHVYASWMPNLEHILEDIMLKQVHKDFRLWLTTMPVLSFPVLVLQSGIKVTKEPPKGLKANLKNSFLLDVTPELWNSCKNAVPWKRLLFSLSFFHAVIQERRKFGALGWNIPYEWNQSDFSASIKSLFTYLSGYEEVPWPALKYMMGVINYGGRVTDFLDSRCLQSLLVKFFDPAVLSSGTYDITDDGVYGIPADLNDFKSVEKTLDALPPYETPELFGLHHNADITYNRNTSRRQLDAILSVQPRSRGGGGISTDDKVFAVAENCTSRLPVEINRDAAHEDTYRITEDGTMVSLGTVVGQEIDVFNAIAGRVRRSLNDLKRAIKGEVVMSATLEAMYTAFTVNRVPENWHKGGYLSRKPLSSWFDDTVNRIEFLRDWNDNAQPLAFWLPGLFFPQGFLTGVLQTHSRTFKIPIDEIKFRTHVMPWTAVDQVEDPPETGVYVHGLYMEGARFDGKENVLAESRNRELFTTMQVLWLEPVLRTEITARSDTYSCPMYKTTARAGALSTTGLSTNFVLSVDLDAGAKAPSHWIQRGVALICMLDD
jgi:dynein heavy chain